MLKQLLSPCIAGGLLNDCYTTKGALSFLKAPQTVDKVRGSFLGFGLLKSKKIMYLRDFLSFFRYNRSIKEKAGRFYDDSECR